MGGRDNKIAARIRQCRHHIEAVAYSSAYILSSLSAIADSNWLTAQIGIIPLLVRGVESVHVDMNDSANGKFTHVGSLA